MINMKCSGLSLRLGLALVLASAVLTMASQDILIEFDYINRFKGYTTSISVDSSGNVELKTFRTKGNEVKRSRNIRLDSKQFMQFRTRLKEVNINSLQPVYGLNSRATDEPFYRFRLLHDHGWKETQIEPYLKTPIAPKPLLALNEFLMQIVNSEE